MVSLLYTDEGYLVRNRSVVSDAGYSQIVIVFCQIYSKTSTIVGKTVEVVEPLNEYFSLSVH